MSVAVPSVGLMSSGSVGVEAAQHQLVMLADLLDDAHARYGDPRAWTLPPSLIAEVVSRFSGHRNWFDAVVLQVLREADRHKIGDAVGAANTAGWWANTSHCTKPAAHREVLLAAKLDDSEHAPTSEAMVAGAVSVEQAAVILDAVEALPRELVGPDLRRDAEKHLVALAEHHDPKELRILGRKILDVIAPEISEEHERKVLEDEEHHAVATASFSMRPDGHGSMFGRFKIPVLAGEILAKHLNAIAAPKHQAAGVSTGSTNGGSVREGHSVSRPLRLGSAFIEYLETRDAAGMPKAGGVPATIVVTMTLESLLGGNKAATLDTGEPISAAEARRLACEAGIIPAVLGGESQVLDLGRKTRFHTEPMRIAIGLRDKGCAEEGCDWPPGMCHAHHLIPWARGGKTSVNDGIMLCPRHHVFAHDDRYQMKAGPGGKVLFTRRT
jgi:hypothetical protein